jgi:sortase (surface protein transpeptidase)
VFYRLDDLKPGDTITVTDAANLVHRFVVYRTRAFPKTRLPPAQLYGPTPVPELRLITCTGTFDQATHNYLDNLVIYAHVVSHRADVQP